MRLKSGFSVGSERHSRFSLSQRLLYLGSFLRYILKADGIRGRMSGLRLLSVFLLFKTRLSARPNPVTIFWKGLRFDVDVSHYDQSVIFPILLGERYDVFDSDLPAAPVAVDVGANIGAFTLELKRKFPSARIYAFEPSPPTFARLQKNLTLNDVDRSRVRTMACAVSDRAGERLFRNRNVAPNSDIVEALGENEGLDNCCSVRTQTLDRFVQEQVVDHIDVLKIDTEGHEIAVLRGALSRAIPITNRIMIEIHRGGDADVIDEMLHQRGFARRVAAGPISAYERVPVEAPSLAPHAGTRV